MKTSWNHLMVPVSLHWANLGNSPRCFKFPVVMTTLTQFWLCTLNCFYFWKLHESGFTWVDNSALLTDPFLLLVSNLSLFSSIYSSTSLFPSAQWRGLLRAAAKPEQTRHTRFHLPRPTLMHKLPANRPPPISSRSLHFSSLFMSLFTPFLCFCYLYRQLSYFFQILYFSASLFLSLPLLSPPQYFSCPFFFNSTSSFYLFF